MREPARLLSQQTSGAADTFVLLRRWQEYLEVSGRANANTRRQYRRYLVSFLADILCDLRAVTEDDVVDHLAGQDPQGKTRGMTLRALRSFYGWASDREVCANPVAKLRPARPKYGPAPSLSPEELEAVLEAAAEIDPRARWALQLAYATGARVGSLCQVTPADVEENWLTFRIAKGDRPYQVPLGARGRAAVAELLALANYTPRTVRTRRPTLVGVGPGTVWRWAHLAGEAAGVRCWTHLLRHTYAQRIAEDPAVPDIAWAELMNHRDASLLRRYASARRSDLAAAVEGL